MSGLKTADAEKSLFDSMVEELKKSPGWVPVVAASSILTPLGVTRGRLWLHKLADPYLALFQSEWPSMISQLRRVVSMTFTVMSREWFAVLVAVVAYYVGDKVDQWVFPRTKRINCVETKTGWRWLDDKFLSTPRKQVCQTLNVQEEGIYKLCLALAKATQVGRCARGMNTASKSLRSAIFPCLFAALILLVDGWALGRGPFTHLGWILGSSFSILIAVALYLGLKVCHIVKLYAAVEHLAKQRQDDKETEAKAYRREESGNVVVFFVKGSQVASAIRTASQITTPAEVDPVWSSAAHGEVFLGCETDPVFSDVVLATETPPRA